MKPQIALTPDQMHELQSLGLDCSDASLAWKIKGEAKPRLMVAINFFEEVKQNMNKLGYVPAYTLEDIIFKLDAQVDFNQTIANEPDTFADCPVEKTPWECSYDQLVSLDMLQKTTGCGIAWGKTPMEAAFNALKEAQIYFSDKIKKL